VGIAYPHAIIALKSQEKIASLPSSEDKNEVSLLKVILQLNEIIIGLKL